MRFLFLTTGLTLIMADVAAIYSNMGIVSCLEETWLLTCLIGLLVLMIVALFDGTRDGPDA